ncbi:hypothetical protein BJI67_15480 [Acidihalobacter aeolianus]|uniref:Type II secretion system protein H n=1 Tax=Acidihalobacter aeolianus TaxID=2792603 RepID=A0A1D8KBG5_9GAMM|nr:GspH/FimT family pseudopilin [Acidihalobacter aeolianus]AOV18276.1 hypothetical protein BJI67_15480 [Acidihalobacter aeolianus]
MGIKTTQAAFTLIELMVVVALVAIFALVGIPSYESLTTTNRMATELNGLLADIQYARSEAIMRGVNVTVCGGSNSTTGSGPALTCNQSTWNSGWIVTSSPSSSAGVIRVHEAISPNDQFSSTITGSGAQLVRITFDRNGFTNNAGTIELNDQSNNVSYRRCLKISMVGRVALLKGNSCP